MNADLASIIDDVRVRIGELERRQRNQTRTGVIDQVDPAKGLARVRLSDGDRPFLTGWLPWEEAAAGANKTHTPPSVGQQVRVNSETGDLTDGTIQGSVNSADNARPSSSGDTHVLLSFGQAMIAVSDDGATMRFSVGATSLTLTDLAATMYSNGSVSVMDAGGIYDIGPRIDHN